MRRLDGEDGRVWDVVLGRESWGSIFAIFVPFEAGASARQAPLRSRDLREASRELDEMDLPALRDLLKRSVPKG